MLNMEKNQPLLFLSDCLRHSQILKLSVVLLAVSLATVYGISGYVGWNLTHPARKSLSVSPGTVGLEYQDVVFPSRKDGLKLKGWLIRAPENRMTVICAHGYRQNRAQNDVPLLPIVQALSRQGINVLMFDFRNCGESEGSMTSVGQYEVLDLLGAVDFILSQSTLNAKIALLGFSMGASVAIMAAEEEPAITAVVADSPFADLTTYLKGNLSAWTDLPAIPFNRTVLTILPVLTGLNPDEVSPLQNVSKLGTRPLLLIHGTADADIPIHDSELLQRAYPLARLLLINGAQHVKGFSTNRELYLTEVLDFLKKL